MEPPLSPRPPRHQTMRILIISNTPFLPVTAGNRARINQMVEFFLKRDTEVGMLMLPAVDIEEWGVDVMRDRLSYFDIAVPFTDSGRSNMGVAIAGRVMGQLASRIRRLIDRALPRPSRPIGVDDWCPWWFRARVAAVTEEWIPDVVIIEYVFLSACLDHVGRRTAHPPLKVIDTHDIMHQRAAAYAAAGLPAQWFHTTYAEEQRGLTRADVVLAIRDADSSVLEEMLPEKTVLTVPHGYRVHPAAPEEALPCRMLFVASYNDLNVRGLQWFFDEVWPQLKVSAPDAELIVCGNICEKLGAVPPGVIIRGFVPSLVAEYARASVVINPVHAGTGLKVKIAEALCHGRPVVSTRPGAADIATGDPEGVIVADSASDFGAAVRRLLDNSDRWKQLTAAATAHAARCFSPEAAFAPLMDHLAAVVSAKRGQARAQATETR